MIFSKKFQVAVSFLLIRNQKKGQVSGTLGTIVKLILAIAGFMIVANIVSGLWGDDISQWESVCETSVAAQNTFSLNLGDTDIKALPLKCQTLDIKVKGDHEEIMRTMSDKVARCWEMFGSGQYDTNMFSNFEIFDDKGGCFTCYEMLIQESSDLKEGEFILPEYFTDFLEEEEYGNTGVSYLDYVQYKAGGPGLIMPIFVGEQSNAALPENIGIGANRAYAIAFGTKTNECEWCKSAIFGGIGAVALAGGGLAAIYFAIPSGGGSLVAYAALAKGAIAFTAVGATGAIGITAGAAGEVSDYFEQRALHTIYVVDITNQEVLNEFHSQCYMIEN